MRICYTLLFFLMFAVLPVHAQQDYQKLWADVYRQAKADKPKNEMTLLGRISDKALRENNYGQLLTADLLRLSLVRQTYGDDSLASDDSWSSGSVRPRPRIRPWLPSTPAP